MLFLWWYCVKESINIWVDAHGTLPISQRFFNPHHFWSAFKHVRSWKHIDLENYLPESKWNIFLTEIHFLTRMWIGCSWQTVYVLSICLVLYYGYKSLPEKLLHSSYIVWSWNCYTVTVSVLIKLLYSLKSI